MMWALNDVDLVLDIVDHHPNYGREVEEQMCWEKVTVSHFNIMLIVISFNKNCVKAIMWYLLKFINGIVTYRNLQNSSSDHGHNFK